MAKVGAYASVNVGSAGGYRPNELTEYAVALLRAVAEGRALPDPRTPSSPTFRGPELVTGRWVGAADDRFDIMAHEGSLRIARGGSERPLYLQGDALVTDHPGLAPYFLAPLDGEPLVLRLGNRLYRRGAAPAVPATPPRLAALTGSYFNPASWSGRTSVFAAGDRLYQGTNALREAPDGSWRYEDPALVSERLWFENIVDGRPQVLNASGARHRRLADS